MYIPAISMCIFLHSQERPMEGMMVWVWSEWPILHVWIFRFKNLRFLTYEGSRLSEWVLPAISMCIFLHSQERPMEGMMVWVWSEWPILHVWIFRFKNLRFLTYEGSRLSEWVLPAISMCIFLHSQERPMEGMMVWVWSEWPILRVWCINFQI